MNRYIALFWNPAEAPTDAWVHEWATDLRKRDQRWVTGSDAPGLRVLVRARQDGVVAATQLEGVRGVVVGPLFARGSEKKGRISLLKTPRDPVQIPQTILNGHWGNYVAIWQDHAFGDCKVLRDPSGAVPCFWTRQRGATLVFANIADVADLLADADIDWNHVQAFLSYVRVLSRRTGLKGVEEVLPGEQLSAPLRGEPRLEWAWNPVARARRAVRQGFKDACAQLRSTAEECAAAWAHEYPRILIQLSGGLDSSAVTGLLCSVKDAGITAVHFTSGGHEGFEVQQARLVAERLGIELIEARPDLRADLKNLLGAPRLARPSRQIFGHEAQTILRETCAAVGATVVMTGQGGDILFMQRSGLRHALGDYLRLNGPGWRASRIAYESAMSQERSVWGVFHDAMLFGAKRKEHAIEQFHMRRDQSANGFARPFAASDLLQQYVHHPWLKAPERLPPGKADHLRNTLLLSYHYPMGGSAPETDFVLPLSSQPVMEFVLRTPSYLFGLGGLDRSLERSAFASLIPEEVQRRAGKGLIDHQLSRMIDHNLPFLRELLLDGLLPTQPWISRERIERFLTPDSLVQGKALSNILQLVAAEIWARSWKTPP